MPHFDHLVDFAFSHQTLIIEGIFATILGIIVVWLFINLQSENEQGPRGETTKEMEAALKKILAATQNNLPQAPPVKEKSATPIPQGVTSASGALTSGAAQTPAPAPQKTVVLQTASVAAPAPGGASASPAPVIIAQMPDNGELGRLKGDIDNRNKKVDELEKSLAQAKNDLAEMTKNNTNPGTIDELRQMVASLEGRLKEYAIIEDDIANLTMYKEENAKLKDELELLRRKNRGGGGGSGGGSGGSVEPASASPVSEAPSTIPSAPGALSEKPAAPKSPMGSDGDGPSWPINEGDSKKLLQEFDSLMGTEIPAAATEILNQANAKEGEKLIADFENFMKGTGG